MFNSVLLIAAILYFLWESYMAFKKCEGNAGRF
jgi:hypothetical protein